MITVKQMRTLERDAQKKGIFAIDLMENAGRELVSTVKEMYDLTNKHVIVFAGCGNNGGDGFVAARYFAEENPVVILLFGGKRKLTEESLENYEKIKSSINVVEIIKEEDLKKFHIQENHELVIIDALLGVGIKGEVREPVSLGINYFNSLDGIKIAADIPSGINADTGEVCGKCCNCDSIITFHDQKVGLGVNKELKSKTIVVDIGIPVI